MPSLAVAFTGRKQNDARSASISFGSKKLKSYLVSSGSLFFAKIDDRGRIYLPARIRRMLSSVLALNSSTKDEFEKKSSKIKNMENLQPDNSKGFSFFAAVAERRIFINASGKYRIDSKNRIFIPADIRRSFGLNVGDVIKLEFGGDSYGNSI